MVFINSRFLTQKITGSQRFVIEISKQLKKLNKDIKFVAPKNIIHQDLATELGRNKKGVELYLVRKLT